MANNFQGVLNEKILPLTSILSSANISDTPVSVLKAAIHKDPRIRTMLGYMMNPKFTMGLPDGVPPYVPSDAILDLAELDVLRLDKKIYIMYSSETRRMRKEEILIQWLEQMAESEAKILIAIKDKTLVDLYPNLTDTIIVESLGWSIDEFNSLKSK